VNRSIVVTVGTDHHPFDRLVAWMDGWAVRNPEVDVFVQHGTAAAPEVAHGSPLIDPTDLASKVRRATAVVTHGGLSSIMESRAAGFLPLVVARDPERGEHVDFHQQRFTAYQHGVGRIRLIETEEDLYAALDAALADPTTVRLPDGLVDVSAAVEEVGGLIDDLLTRRPSRTRRKATT
jgi:UDP-N-acetylglucosamine transferase subunit ALG13